MARCRVILVVVALLAAGVLAAQPSGSARGQQYQPDQYTIRTTARLVLLDVSVKDSAGGFVSGLTKGNFKISEDGKPQTITEFADADIPVTVGLVVDASGSMRPKRPEVVTAALAFIRASNPHDEVFVINFNEQPRRGLPNQMLFSDDIQQLRDALWQGNPEGRTSLYDAMEMALKQLESGRRDKKTLVLISDGGDNHSAHKLPEVMQDVLTSVATIYAIGIFDADDIDKNPHVLDRFARVSGGSVYFPEKLDQIEPICRQIAKDIRTRYTIGYIPRSEGQKERHIKVTASAAGRQKLVVRTRTSYLFPSDGSGGESK